MLWGKEGEEFSENTQHAMHTTRTTLKSIIIIIIIMSTKVMLMRMNKELMMLAQAPPPGVSAWCVDGKVNELEAGMHLLSPHLSLLSSFIRPSSFIYTHTW